MPQQPASQPAGEQEAQVLFLQHLIKCGVVCVWGASPLMTQELLEFQNLRLHSRPHESAF